MKRNNHDDVRRIQNQAVVVSVRETLRSAKAVVVVVVVVVVLVLFCRC